jgi:NAD-dependent dihydropyrimidine dehydrogenase PreA subunit
MGNVMREIVKIDEDKCNGCGECVPSCAEGAIQIIDGKARLVGENLCDGLGNCLGTCPTGAITIEQRPAEAFDEQAVDQHLRQETQEKTAGTSTAGDQASDAGGCPSAKAGPPAGGCPGAMLRKLAGDDAPAPQKPAGGSSGVRSALGQWPVQLSLLPAGGDLWDDADILLAADCAAFAMGDFHDRLLKGRTLAIACPKLDDTQPYVDKLATIFANHSVRSLTIARMEVPCCGGLEAIVRQAMDQADLSIPLTVVTLSSSGTIQSVNGVAVGA